MNWLDFVLGLILVASMAAGFGRGFARSVVGLTATLLGLLLGLWFYGVAGAALVPYLSSRGLANFGGFLLIFFGTLAAGALVGWILAKILKWAGLGWLDRLGGAAFGLLRGTLIAAVLVMAMLAFAPKPPPQAVVNSRLAPYVIEAGHVMAAIAPRELSDGFKASYDHVKKLWREAVEKGAERVPRQDL